MRLFKEVDFIMFTFICISSKMKCFSSFTGVIPGNGEEQIKVVFSPMDFTTAHMKLQLLISQFNAQPLVCAFTGTSEPGLAKRWTVQESV